jgi:hypothetical protein
MIATTMRGRTAHSVVILLAGRREQRTVDVVMAGSRA